jgi:Mg2+ and Co2+ transporter CorA
MGKRSIGFLLYSLLDALVDGYFPVLDDIAERADTLEETMILEGQPGFQAEILQLRRDLLMIRRLVGPERDVMNVLVRRDPPVFTSKEIIYFPGRRGEQNSPLVTLIFRSDDPAPGIAPEAITTRSPQR